MQREKEIEDGVEAPPGYLPKFQLNRIQNAAQAALTTTNNNTTTTLQSSLSTPTLSSQSTAAAATSNQTMPLARQQHHPQQQPQSTAVPSLGGLGAASQWPHVICASSPDWQAQQQRFLVQQQQAMLANAAGAAAAMAAHQQASSPAAPKVHSQVDFIHCLVPDLQKITSCGFYWGKMDRYQAETLLDGKPEGTFLLRDSAQEEFLFSVSFRKYGRSLHARIEQFNHKFR